MKLTVEAVSPNCKIIYMWGEFNATDYIFQKENMWIYSKEMLYRPLLLNAVLLSYSTNHDFRYLLYIIGVYLEFRDLRNALIFIERYLGSDYLNMNEMLDLKSGLLNLLDEIKQKLATKQNPHTLVLIADRMGAKDVTPELTPFLYALGKRNICCPNAHSHMGWTSTSILTIFKQKSYIDNHLYKDVKLAGTEPFFEYLANNDVDFSYYCPCEKKLFDNILGAFKYNRNGCADMMWQYLCSAFENDKKGLYFLHFVETHAPCLCLYHVEKVCFFKDTNDYFDCVKYVDSQADFLFELLPNSTKLLFCSGHGYVRGFLAKKGQLSEYDNGGHHELLFGSTDINSPSLFAEYISNNFLKKNKSIVDLGCGNDRDSLLFIQNGLHVTAVDGSETAIYNLKRTYGWGNQINFLCSDFADSPLIYNKLYDYFYSRFSIDFLQNRLTVQNCKYHKSS